MKRLLAIALVLCFPAASMAKKRHDYQTAKVISQDIQVQDRGSAVMPLYGGLVDVPLSQKTNTIVIETSRRRMTWVEAGNHAVVLTVNGTVDFYQDGGYFIVLDSRGKKHKFSPVHSELLPTATAN